MIRSRRVVLSASAALAFAGSALAVTLHTTVDGGALAVIDSSTGAGTLIGPFGYSGVYGLAFSPSGTLYGEAGGHLATVNLSTGAATLIGTSAWDRRHCSSQPMERFMLLISPTPAPTCTG